MPEARTLDGRPRRGKRPGEVLGEPGFLLRRMGRARQPLGGMGGWLDRGESPFP
jgi:hypothetical protein